MATKPAQKPAAKPAAAKPAAPALPDTRPELVALAIRRGVPSYEAWAMTVDQLKTKLEAR
ncbi:hypothetical protein CLV30_12825 [Haloactinopolyspora alba]|uniref:Uncharacterized protein n=1 Tax=Haloactinopolyspora alba TaxID=648780 RepID=A0A2P8DEX3_9ACTN|nr:hypothetical protein [Haloactinopolyspora alba]PSK95773.1 hypothetical protein CLV30_12825 [Haloactinopolyspora alba]